jgi:hypothetical protein
MAFSTFGACFFAVAGVVDWAKRLTDRMVKAAIISILNDFIVVDFYLN